MTEPRASQAPVRVPARAPSQEPKTFESATTFMAPAGLDALRIF